MKTLLTVFVLLSSLIFSQAQEFKVVTFEGGNLQTFINNLSDSTIVNFSVSTIETEESIILTNKKNIQFNFDGFTLKSRTQGRSARPTLDVYKNKWPRNRSHFVIANSHNVLIEGLVIDGPNRKGGKNDDAYVRGLEAQHAIEIRNSKKVEIKNCKLSYIYGDGVYITGNSKAITIADSKISNNGRQGIAITAGSDIEIIGNKITEIRRSHIDLEPNNDNQVVSNVRILNNTFGPKRLNWIAAASSKGKVSDILVEGNEMNCPGNIWIGNKSNKFRQGPYTFLNNTSHLLYGTNNGGIWRLIQVDGFKADGNNIMAQARRDMHLIYATRCNDIDLGTNEVPNGTNAVKTFYDPNAKK